MRAYVFIATAVDIELTASCAVVVQLHAPDGCVIVGAGGRAVQCQDSFGAKGACVLVNSSVRSVNEQLCWPEVCGFFALCCLCRSRSSSAGSSLVEPCLWPC